MDSTLDIKDIKWMKFCIQGAEIFSTCAKQQYMAIIVDRHGIVDSTGYNGTPTGFQHCTDGGCPRQRNNVPSGTPYDYGDGLCYAIHAEINCLIHSDVGARRGGAMYVNGVPCFGCAKTLVNSGLAKVVYLNEGFEREGHQEMIQLFNRSKVELVGLQLEGR